MVLLRTQATEFSFSLWVFKATNNPPTFCQVGMSFLPNFRRVSLLIQVDTWVWEYREGADETDPQGLHTKTVGLHFQIQNSHFASNGGGLVSRMEIGCTATVGGKTRHKAVFPSLARSLTSNKLAQERFQNAAGNVYATELTPYSYQR
jgi:hypothetical protein